MGQSLHRLVYHSRGCFPEDPDAPAAIVRSILVSSRARNEASDITGVLMLAAGCFGQVLEGPEDVVSTTFSRIKKDDRHNEVALLTFEPVAERRFSQWSMRCVSRLPPEAEPRFNPSGATAARLLEMLEMLAHAPPGYGSETQTGQVWSARQDA